MIDQGVFPLTLVDVDVVDLEVIDHDNREIEDEFTVIVPYTTNDIYSENHPWDSRLSGGYRFRPDIWCTPELLRRSADFRDIFFWDMWYIYSIAEV